MKQQYIDLAELILQKMVEEEVLYSGLPEDFKMPEAIVKLTALDLQEAKVEKYYVGIDEDFGGHFETQLDLALKISILQKSRAERDTETITIINTLYLSGKEVEILKESASLFGAEVLESQQAQDVEGNPMDRYFVKINCTDASAIWELSKTCQTVMEVLKNSQKDL